MEDDYHTQKKNKHLKIMDAIANKLEIDKRTRDMAHRYH